MEESKGHPKKNNSNYDDYNMRWLIIANETFTSYLTQIC